MRRAWNTLQLEEKGNENHCGSDRAAPAHGPDWQDHLRDFRKVSHQPRRP